MFPYTTKLLIIIGTIIIISIVVSFYFVQRNKKRSIDITPLESNDMYLQETTATTDQATVDLLPGITEIKTDHISDKEYEKFKLPAGAMDMLQQTVHSAFPVIKDFVSYKIQFSPETLRKMKEGTMELGKRRDGSGFIPMAKNNLLPCKIHWIV